jgi:large subunit ribosomal protein L31e
MAKNDKKEKKIVLERVYNVPLRKKYQRAPRWKKTNRAVSALREFVKKHMKATEIKIGKHINKDMWKNGIRNPPHHVKVNCVKDEDGLVKVEMVGAPVEKPKEAPKKAKAEETTEIKVKDALGDEKLEDVIAPKEEKAEKAKEIEKEEIKELKKQPKTHAPKQAPAPKKVEQHPTAPQQKG